MSNRPFTYLLRVRYSECDAQKVVFNAKYIEYVDLAATEFLKAVWGHYDDLNEQGVDFQVVNMNIDWRVSVRFDEVLAIEVTTERIGNTSYQLNFIMRLPKSNQVTTQAQAIYVMVDPLSLQKKPVPTEMRGALLDGASGQIVNHAGIEYP